MKCKYETTGWYEGMKRCLGTKEVDPCPGYEKCQHFKPYRMTNADRIRAMTDKELAEFIISGTERDDFFIDGADWLRKEEFLDWLKQPYGGAEG